MACFRSFRCNGAFYFSPLPAEPVLQGLIINDIQKVFFYTSSILKYIQISTGGYLGCFSSPCIFLDHPSTRLTYLSICENRILAALIAAKILFSHLSPLPILGGVGGGADFPNFKNTVGRYHSALAQKCNNLIEYNPHAGLFKKINMPPVSTSGVFRWCMAIPCPLRGRIC